MFHDPSCKPEIKPDVCNIATLISWLETKNPNESYDYCDNRECLLGQYLSAHGYKRPSVRLNNADFLDGETIEMPEIFRDIAIGDGLRSGWNFAAALKRARAFAHV